MAVKMSEPRLDHGLTNWRDSEKIDSSAICHLHCSDLIKKMTQIHTAAIILGCYFAIAHALVFDKCTRHDQCPQNSKCRPTGCDGYTCRCDPNYVHSHNRASCLPARKIGYSCNAKTSKCLSNFAICVDNVCRCNDLMEPTPEGRCKDPEFSVLEESCLTKPCSGGTVCEGDTCVCPQDMRRLTDEEFWIDAMNTDYCIDKDFSVDFCNGTRLPIPMLTTPPPSVNQPGGSLSDTTPSFPRSFTKIVSLVEQDADIYDLCSRHEQCPAHAQCRPEGCKGFSCLCDKGYMATTDRKSCVKAVKVNEACDTNTSCISPFALCDGVCRCLDIFVPTKDGRCKLPDISFVGEECSLDKCEYPATCVDGICRCVGEYREITSEEFWVDPTNIWQCAKDNTSLATCNGLNVTLPTAMTPPLPKINKETTPSNIISTTTRGKETTPFNILSTTPIADITTKIIDELSSQSTKTTTATNRQKTTLNVLDNGEHASESTTSSKASPSSEFPTEALSSTRSGTDIGLDENKMTSTKKTATTTTKTTQMVTSFTTSETGKVVAQSTTTTSSVHPSSESANPDDRNLSRDSQTGSTTTRQPTTSTQSLSTDDRNLSRDSQTSSPTNQPKTSTNFPFGPTINSYLCESLAFHCSEILCIPSNWVCNGEKDCPDGRDEDRSICIVPDLDPDTETVTFETMISMSPNTTATSVNTTAHVPEVPELKEKEPAEKSYTGTAGLGSLESIAIAAAAGLVFLINVIGIILALTRRNRRRKLDKKPPSTMNTSMASSDDTESGNFKIPRPNVLYPPYYVKEDWNTWNSTHFTQYAEQMYAMDEHSDFYPGSLKTL
uniref:EGF-like domain-containing protein n=1 Tax=Magallana gigas TaxID=29159 RepID=K1PRW9_MAGGI